MAATSRDYYELPRRRPQRLRVRSQAAFRARRASSTLDVSDAPDAEERFREVVEAYEELKSETRELYDRFGHAGLQGGGFRPTDFDFGSLSDLFSAFFGDDLRRLALDPAPRGADVAAEVAIELADAATGVHRDVPFDVVVGRGRCEGTGAEPGSRVADCDGCGGTGRIQQVGRSVFGEFVRAQLKSALGRRYPTIEQPCENCEGSGRVVERRTPRSRSRPGSMTASGLARARATSGSSGRPRAMSTSTCVSAGRLVSSARATTSIRRST